MSNKDRYIERRIREDELAEERAYSFESGLKALQELIGDYEAAMMDYEDYNVPEPKGSLTLWGQLEEVRSQITSMQS